MAGDLESSASGGRVSDVLYGALRSESTQSIGGGWFKTLDKNTIGAANTEINKPKWTQIYQARRVLHNLYGTNQDTSIRWMEKGLADACFWDPPNSDYENADFTEKDASNKVNDAFQITV